MVRILCTVRCIYIPMGLGWRFLVPDDPVLKLQSSLQRVGLESPSTQLNTQLNTPLDIKLLQLRLQDLRRTHFSLAEGVPSHVSSIP